MPLERAPPSGYANLSRRKNYDGFFREFREEEQEGITYGWQMCPSLILTFGCQIGSKTFIDGGVLGCHKRGIIKPLVRFLTGFFFSHPRIAAVLFPEAELHTDGGSLRPTGMGWGEPM